MGKIVAQCILQGICACLTYNATKTDPSCFGPKPLSIESGSKTPYDDAIQSYISETTTPLTVPDGCQPSLFYVFQRHSTRTPKAGNTVAIDRYLPKLQAKLKKHKKHSLLCKTDIDAIQAWKNPFDIHDNGLVTETGRQSVRDQVKRLRKRFPTVFEGRQPMENVQMDFSERGNRSFETGVEFLKEWFGADTYHNEIADKIKNNTNNLNNFKDTCEQIMAEHNITVSTPLYKTLQESKAFKEFKKVIGGRLGFDVKTKHIKAAMDQCRYEAAVLGSSPWCALFSAEDMKFFELRDDVKTYEEDSYGTRRNTIMACPIINDLLQHISESGESETTKPKVVLHFSHAGAIKRVATLLGLGRFSSPDCDSRGWRTFQATPFNANLNVVHYKCENKPNRVAVLWNEKPYHLPGCSEPLCTTDELVSALKPKAENCDYQRICSC